MLKTLPLAAATEDGEAAVGIAVRGRFQIADGKRTRRHASGLGSTPVGPSIRVRVLHLFWRGETGLCLSFDCLKFIIPGGKLSLHCK